MKKWILGILILMIGIIPVSARENRLYFKDDGNRLYYESKYLDEKVFMKHTDMTPGASYQDTIIIENGTRTTYTLFLKAIPKDLDNETRELLENITMRITLDGREIYNGKATGEDYNNQGIDLKDAVLLGDFIPNRSSTMVVETKLLENYSNTHFRDDSSIDWSFYANYDDSKPDIINPETTTQKSRSYQLIFGLMILMIVALMIWVRKQERKRS